MSSNHDAKKSRGRPKVDSTVPLSVRLSPEQLAALDAWRREQTDLPGRPEAVRRLMELGMTVRKRPARLAMARGELVMAGDA
jgi:hypothetical protein